MLEGETYGRYDWRPPVWLFVLTIVLFGTSAGLAAYFWKKADLCEQAKECIQPIEK